MYVSIIIYLCNFMYVNVYCIHLFQEQFCNLTQILGLVGSLIDHAFHPASSMKHLKLRPEPHREERHIICIFGGRVFVINI